MYLSIDTGNRKIVGEPRRGFAAALTLPIANTCPRSCPLRDRGCYAQGGRLALHERRLARANEGRTALAVARDAAREISDAAARGLATGRALRLFQAGDARTEASARELARASREWLRSGGTAVWGYTHAWRDVSALASLERVSDAKAAYRAGYALARVVSEHPPDGRAFSEGGFTWIPCPEQTRGAPCVTCRLCWDASALRARRAGVAFAAHGQRAANVKRRLEVIQ